jgi:hypothetical protein
MGKLDPCIMEFIDESASSIQIVGNFDDFRSKKDFLEEAERNFIDNDKSYGVKDVYIGYAKWYDNPDDAHVAPLDIFEKGCYSWASQKDEKGAFKVYAIDL